MKEKIIIFLVGLLLGAIISTGAIYFYTIANNNNQFERNQLNDKMGDIKENEPPSMPGQDKPND